MSRKGTIAPTHKTRGSTSVRARILDAAITEFAANGFSGGRIDRIAQSAVVNRAMLYYYYADKQELFHLAVCSAVAALLETADWDDAQPLKSLSRSWQLAHADPRYLRLIQWAWLESDRAMLPIADKLRERFTSITRLFSEDDPDARQKAWCLIAAAVVPFAWPHMTETLTGESPSNDLYSQTHERLLRNLVTSLRKAHRQRRK